MFGFDVARLFSYGESHSQDPHMIWAKTEYKRDWVYHYHRLKHTPQKPKGKMHESKND